MKYNSTLQYWAVKLIHTYSTILINYHKQYIKEVCENGGDILEIGFGAGSTANMIQTYNIKSHTIIERDEYFFKKLCEWSHNKPNVKVVHGDGIKDIPTDKKYDGIFVDLWNSKEDYHLRKSLCNTLETHTNPGTVLICATDKVFNKELYIGKGHKYEEIKVNKPKIKWYHVLSHILLYLFSKENGNINHHHIPKVTYK
tara:strand:+ start:1631 stop:2227 length:597 start_codon:yes stop_codon:yes gene_type:complete